MQTPMRATLVDFFRDLETRRGDFLVYDDGYRVHRHTYADVARAARGFAARLSSAGVTSGDKVVFWGENRPEWIACFWGCLIAGVIVVPIDYRASAEFLTKVRRIVRARIVLAGADVTWPDGWVEDPDFVRWRFADLDWSADGPVPTVAVTPDDVTQIVFTSGATAEPKGVVIRHRNILANVVPVEREVAKYKRYIRPFSPIRFLNLLPLSHLFGQSMAANIPPMVNGTVFFMRSFNPVDIVRLVKQWRISVIVCVPKILDVLREHAIRVDPGAADAPAGLSIPARWWRYRKIHKMLGVKFWAFVVGAAPLGPRLEDFWKRLGFVVIQGYGLTETAPIVTLNHPFKTNTGSVGKPIAGVEVRIAEDGEILVRGENVTSGYYDDGSRESGVGSRASGVASRQSPVVGAAQGLPTPDSRLPRLGRTLDDEGWLHTGDVGELDAEGRLFIRGRKKEMIVTPEGLNVFPDDVEAVLNRVAGVKESAVVAASSGSSESDERVHAVLVLDDGIDPEVVIAEANRSLQDHQRVRGVSVWPGDALPRTEGTKKLKRQAVREWVATGKPVAAPASSDDALQALIEKFAGARAVGGTTSLEQLGLSSLERVELMVALEDKFQTRLDETRFSEARTLDELRALVAQAPEQAEVIEPVDFPAWNRHPIVGLVRRLSLATWILPLARVFAWLDVRGLEHIRHLQGPVVFAANHQSHFDVPVILAALPGHIRKTVAPAMAKEFFKEHFFPEGHSWRPIFIKRLNYYLAAFFFNAFPLPQREAGARQTLRYIGEITGDGFSVLIFPEGARTSDGAIHAFRGGIGMIGSRLALPIVPVRIEGADQVLHQKAKMARPSRVTVTFGAPLQLTGDDYAAEAARVEAAVKAL
jgi:long-chain acyl-CoA synthetase